MLVVFATEDHDKYKRHDIIAFHSSMQDQKGNSLEPQKTNLPKECYAYWGIPKKKTDFLIVPDNFELMKKQGDFRVNKLRNGIERKLKPILILTTDARDTVQPYDGYPDIPANGVSEATIYIQKSFLGGDPCAKDSDNEELIIETSRGKLSNLKVKLKKGKASFKVKSVPETVLATITVFDPSGTIDPAKIVIQFA